MAGRCLLVVSALLGGAFASGVYATESSLRSLEETVQSLQTALSAALTRLAVVETSCGAVAEQFKLNLDAISPRRQLLAETARGPHTSITKDAVSTTFVSGSYLNITQDIHLGGTLFVDGVAWRPFDPSPAPTSAPPSPAPSSKPTASLLPGKHGSYGGGWSYVHESGRSATDINDLGTTVPGAYTLHTYVITKPFNEVLVQRVSANWCDSWGKHTPYWVRSNVVTEGASMGINADANYFYYMNNAYSLHTWMRQPTSYLPMYGGSCGACYQWQDGPTYLVDPPGVTIADLESDGSVVKIAFPEAKAKLVLGNFDALIGAAGGCDASGPVSYRVYTRDYVAAQYGAGWAYVHESGRSATNMADLGTTVPGAYTLHTYVITKPFNEVLVQRVSANWCDSWGKNTGRWASTDSSGASMGINADAEHFYYHNNAYSLHTWVRQPTTFMPSYGGVCGLCHEWQDGAFRGMTEVDPPEATVHELEADGSVVTVRFAELKSRLTVANFDALIGASGGCDAAGSVSYRVFTRSV